MRRTKADAEATRQQILGAAERVFFEKGVSNASMEEVAIAAGVPESGTGTTRSATAGFSRASSAPIRFRTAWTPRPPITESGREK